MSIPCSCGDYGDYEWWYEQQDQKPLETKRSRKCCSCGAKIPVGELATEFHRLRTPENEIEERIYGDEIYMSSWYMCETCGDLYESIVELGYCVTLTKGENMRDLVKMTRGELE